MHPAALDSLARDHQAFLIGFARKLCGSIDDPADLVQDVFEKAVKTPERIPPDGARNWLVRVMRNTFVDHLRRHVARPPARALEERCVSAPVADAPPWWSALDADAVRGCLARLPDDQREAFEQYAFARLTYDQIAARTGVPKATIGTRILRARRRLREMLTAERTALGAMAACA